MDIIVFCSGYYSGGIMLAFVRSTLHCSLFTNCPQLLKFSADNICVFIYLFASTEYSLCHTFSVCLQKDSAYNTQHSCEVSIIFCLIYNCENKVIKWSITCSNSQVTKW